MTITERLSRPCPKGHPLWARYFTATKEKWHPYGRVRCRLCLAKTSQICRDKARRKLSREIIALFPDLEAAAAQLTRVLHLEPGYALWRLKGKRADEWQINRIVAAVELGLITHPGIAPDAPIPFDPVLDVELTIEEKAKMARKRDLSPTQSRNSVEAEKSLGGLLALNGGPL